MARQTITKRWILNNLCVVLLVLLTVELGFIYAIQNYYYGGAQQYLLSKMNAVSGVLSRYAEDSPASFSAEIRNTLENFSDKDKIELMAIDVRGHVVLTSSGFSPDERVSMPDYDMAMEGDRNAYSYTVGRLRSGEHVMAVTYPIEDLSDEYTAVRMVISLTEIDANILTFSVAMTLLCIGVFLLLALSGMYFIRSIVFPIRQISTTAEKFAKGDFSVRIAASGKDEIGDLCTAINHMADELSATETMKNEFISSVSHELRTPLTAIKGWAETLNAGGDMETMHKGIRVITNETERLSRMVEELLDFSRMQSGHFTMQMDKMDVLAELGEAVLIYTERARREHIEILYNEPEFLPIVYGDKNRIRQVFINIIDNAIKYSNPGGKVQITATQKDEGKTVCIVVEDQGVGIKASDLPKIKTKFYKANHSRRGSGIGLGVADEIIRQHGGRLEIASAEGVGTTVTIDIPAAGHGKA